MKLNSKLKKKLKAWHTGATPQVIPTTPGIAPEIYNAVLLTVLQYLTELSRIDVINNYPDTFNWKTKLAKPGLGLKTRILSATTRELNHRIRIRLSGFGIDASDKGVPPSRIGEASTIGGLVLTVCKYFSVAVPKAVLP